MEAWELDTYEYVKAYHKGQLDDEGKSYFEAHILQVVQIVKQITSDPDIIMAAYCHDLIEDTEATYKWIKVLFGQRVADLVNEVTHEGQKDNIGYYFPRLHSKDAILIKFADRLSNLSRMEAWPEKRREQYLRKSKFWISDPKEKNNV